MVKSNNKQTRKGRRNAQFKTNRLVEPKYTTSTTALGTVIGTGLSVYTINCSTSSSGPAGRIGCHTIVRRILARFTLQYNNAAATNQQVMRVLIVYDTETLGSAPVFSDLFDTTLAGSGPYNSYNVLNFYGQIPRFRVLMDRTYDLDKQSVNRSTYSVQFHPQVKLPVRYYNTANNNITDIQKGSILFCVVSNDNTGNGPLLTLDARCIFYDP